MQGNGEQMICAFWDCATACVLPHYCSEDHQARAVTGQMQGDRAIVVDGALFKQDEQIAEKILKSLAANRACGVPVFPENVFSTSPYDQVVFDRLLQPDEAQRCWIFLSESSPPRRAGAGAVWNTPYEPDKPRGVLMKRTRWYLVNPCLGGRYRLQKYRAEGVQLAVYWLSFTPFVKGSSEPPAEPERVPPVETNRKRPGGADASAFELKKKGKDESEQQHSGGNRQQVSGRVKASEENMMLMLLKEMHGKGWQLDADASASELGKDESEKHASARVSGRDMMGKEKEADDTLAAAMSNLFNMEFCNTMVEKDDEKAAMKAYKVAREDCEQTDEVAEALMEKVDGLMLKDTLALANEGLISEIKREAWEVGK